jgi:hypothetical protein
MAGEVAACGLGCGDGVEVRAGRARWEAGVWLPQDATSNTSALAPKAVLRRITDASQRVGSNGSLPMVREGEALHQFW